MATRISVETLPGGGQEVRVVELPPDHLRGGDGASLSGPLKPGEPAQLSAAQARLHRLRKGTPGVPQVQRVEAGGETWFIRRVNLPLLHEISLRTPRDENGALDLGGGNEYATFLAACLYTCVVVGEHDATPLFERNKSGWDEAVQMAQDADEKVVDLNAVLISEILLLNPEILPEATAELVNLAQSVAAAVEDAVGPLVQAPESLTLPDGQQSDGSAATPFIEAQSSSPTDFSPTQEAPPPTSPETAA